MTGTDGTVLALLWTEDTDNYSLQNHSNIVAYNYGYFQIQKIVLEPESTPAMTESCS